MDITIIFRILHFIVSIFVFTLYIRFFLSVFRFSTGNRIEYYIKRITDPYIKIFSNIKLARLGNIDLSFLFGLVVANALQHTFANLAYYGLVISIPGVFIIFFSGLFRSGFFFIGFLGFLGLVRLIGIYLKASSLTQVWYFLDQLLQPMVYWISSKLSPRRELPYGTSIIIFIAIFALISVLGNLGISLIPETWVFISS
jgi:uncharacterized protein YggT (Ycf19 family)